jgi:predicted enzyme related to lactoylglutathione lyase
MEKKMSDADKQTPINYVEFPANDLSKIKAFYTAAFNWVFTDYGPEYVAFSNAGIDGGFYYAELNADADKGSALLVLHTHALEETLQKVVDCGGTIKTDIFSFPGGRRFHFLDPCQNELSVWTTE